MAFVLRLYEGPAPCLLLPPPPEDLQESSLILAQDCTVLHLAFSRVSFLVRGRRRCRPVPNSPSSSHDSPAKPDSKQGHVDGDLKLVLQSAVF